MYTFEQIKTRIENFEFAEEFDVIVAVANGGIIPAAMLNQKLQIEFNIIKISLRDVSQKPMYEKPKLIADITFDVHDKRVLLVEDRVKTGASLALAKSVIENSGAQCVKTFAVNGKADYSLLDVPCFKFPWL